MTALMRSTTRSRTRRRATLVLALVLAAGLTLGGCKTTRDVQAGGPLVGLTDNSVKVGFTIVDSSTLNLGFKKVDNGGVAGQTKVINAFVDYVNAHGGLGGRKLVPVIRSYVAANDSPAASQAQCSAYTQDEKVFAVVMDGQLQNSGATCYVRKQTLLLDETLVAHDRDQFEGSSPYLWSPSHPEYGTFVQAELKVMNDAKFFDGNTGVLLMVSDDEVARRITETVVRPYLNAIGVKTIKVGYVDSSNGGTLNTTSDRALDAGKSQGLNRVVVIGGSRIEPFALSSSAVVKYPARWGISTYDNPQFNEYNPEDITPERRVGQIGLGYDAFQDVGLAQQPPLPDPSNPAQVLCHTIVTQAGATPPAGLRQSWSTAMQYCDGVMFLKAVMDKAPRGGSVTGDQFKTAAGEIGDTYHSAVSFGSQWGPGIYAGTNTGRVLAWQEACGCYQYGPTVTFGQPTAPTPLDTITVTP